MWRRDRMVPYPRIPPTAVSLAGLHRIRQHGHFPASVPVSVNDDVHFSRDRPSYDSPPSPSTCCAAVLLISSKSSIRPSLFYRLVYQTQQENARRSQVIQRPSWSAPARPRAGMSCASREGRDQPLLHLRSFPSSSTTPSHKA